MSKRARSYYGSGEDDDTAPLIGAETPDSKHESKKQKPNTVSKYVALFRKLLGRRKMKDREWKNTLQYFIDDQLKKAFPFFDTLERCLSDVLDDQVEIRDALRVAAVTIAVTEAMAEPAASSAGRKNGYALIRDALSEFISQTKSAETKGEPFAEIDRELYILQTCLKSEIAVEALKEETERQKKMMHFVEYSGWTLLGVALGAIIALAFVAPPAAVVTMGAGVTAVTQVRPYFLEMYNKNKGKLKDISHAIEDFVESVDANDNCVVTYKKLVAEDWRCVHDLAIKLHSSLDSQLKNRVTTGEASLKVKGQIGKFRREQRRFMRTLRVITKQAQDSRQRMRKTAKAVLRELGCTRAVANLPH